MIKNLLKYKEDKLEMAISLDYYNTILGYIKPDMYRIVKENKREYIYILLTKAELNTSTKTVELVFLGSRTNDSDKPGDCTLNFSIESVLTMLINKENPNTDNILFYGYSDNDRSGFYMDLLKELTNS